MKLKSQAFANLTFFNREPNNQIFICPYGWGGGGDVCLKRLLRDEGAVAYPDTFPATACLPGVVDKETTQGHYQGHL